MTLVPMQMPWILELAPKPNEGKTMEARKTCPISADISDSFATCAALSSGILMVLIKKLKFTQLQPPELFYQSLR